MISLYNLFTFLLLVFNMPVASEPKAIMNTSPVKKVHSTEEKDDYLPWFSDRRLAGMILDVHPNRIPTRWH
jgi:hypothetical protein